MFRCVVGIFGLPREITGLQKVEIELNNGAGLRDIIVALKREIPKMEGSVFVTGEERLMENYAFNINGRFYRNVTEELQLQEGDHIALLTLATGG